MQDKNGPLVEITVCTSPLIDLEKGADGFITCNPSTDEIVGHMSLKSPTTRTYSGTMRVRGTVFKCDGVDEIDLVDVEIVSGG